jgi:hypothetical protein
MNMARAAATGKCVCSYSIPAATTKGHGMMPPGRRRWSPPVSFRATEEEKNHLSHCSATIQVLDSRLLVPAADPSSHDHRGSVCSSHQPCSKSKHRITFSLDRHTCALAQRVLGEPWNEQRLCPPRANSTGPAPVNSEHQQPMQYSDLRRTKPSVYIHSSHN